MNKYILVTLFSFLCLTAHANLAGDWIGWGTWKFKGEGDGVVCNPMTMQWSESKTEIGITGGLFDCQIVAMHLGETKWKLQDGKLFDDANSEVGSYDGTTLEVYMASPNENTTIYVKVVRAANHYDYQEIWYNPQQKVYVIEGRLFTSGAKKSAVINSRVITFTRGLK